ncbi:hypothetical protein ACFRIC_28815 [Streptomyces sp. NPDC056738]|uniref:hypothetical protein n=1 Tax=Streptomyces sp. NPDC056738 TaxID=3345933 RepID=UPI0036B3AB2A
MGNTVLPPVKPSVDHLMDAPLQQLVDELGIELVVASITEPGFTGYAYADRDGVTVALPPDRTELEHDCMARYLIGSAFQVDGLPPLPDMFKVVDITADVNRAHRSQADEALRQVRGEAV